MKQNEAVFSAVTEVLGTFTGKATLTREQRSDVTDIVTKGILDGSVDFSAEAKAKHADDKAVRAYVVGMVNNWLRKDVRLNGGAKYEVQNPGSRGPADEQLKALSVLRKQMEGDATKLAEIDAAIATRKAELKPAKAPKAPKVTTIDTSSIPDELKIALGIAS